MFGTEEVRDRVDAMMPGVIEDLAALVRFPSVAFPGFPAEPVVACANAVVELLKRHGAENARLIEIPNGYPAAYAEVAGPVGAPTVLLYGHYDVQPAPMSQGWYTDPWDPVILDGRMHGRGSADNKSGVVISAASLAIFEGKPPVTIRILIEGEEEADSHLEEFVEANPELVEADLFVINDKGNLEVGAPVLTTTLRGDVSCVVEVRTIEHPLHSGVFGGPTPDALMALIRILDTLLDEDGSCAVPGVTSREWEGAEIPEDVLRTHANLLPGVKLVGRGSIGTRLWSSPSINVLGIDAPSIAEASNVLIPRASAAIAMRIPPGGDPVAEREKLVEHVRSVVPWNAEVNVTPFKTLDSFSAPSGGPAFTTALGAMEAAFGVPANQVGSGGSIPLLGTLARLCPNAEFVLWGAEDMARARIHGSNESADIGEIARLITAQALLLARLGDPEE